MTSSVEPKTSGLGKTIATGGLVVAACAACCAPLIAPPIIALIAAGGAGLALAGQIGLGVLVLAGIAVYVVSQRRRAAARKATIACNCAPDAGCNVGDSCELPVAASPPGLLQRCRNLLRSIC